MIYENIKAICQAKNISISALEKKAGVSNGTISKWKNSNPTVEYLTKVANALGVSVSRLMKPQGE